MNTAWYCLTGIACAAALGTSPTAAELIDRGGGLIYDTEQDITWLQDANYAATRGFHPTGRMTWPMAMSWAAGLVYEDTQRGRIWDDWRLPTARERDGSDPCFGFFCTGSEVGHLYYIDGIQRGSPGPFVNFRGTAYWTNTERTPFPGTAWLFGFGPPPEGGKQDHTGSLEDALTAFAWAVRDGDVAANPSVLQDDRAVVTTGGTVAVNVMANDAGGEAPLDPATVQIVSAPINGHVEIVDADGTVRYRHDGKGAVTDAFAYSVRTADGTTVGPASVQVDVNHASTVTDNGQNDTEGSPATPPVAQPAPTDPADDAAAAHGGGSLAPLSLLALAAVRIRRKDGLSARYRDSPLTP